MIEDKLTETVINAAMEVHSTVGAGLLEKVYEECLCRELALRHLPFKRQIYLPVEYKGVHLDCGYVMDIVIPDDRLIIEVKSVERLLPVHQAQLITYLKVAGIQTGLLINFNVDHLRHGIRRLHG